MFLGLTARSMLYRLAVWVMVQLHRHFLIMAPLMVVASRHSLPSMNLAGVWQLLAGQRGKLMASSILFSIPLQRAFYTLTQKARLRGKTSSEATLRSSVTFCENDRLKQSRYDMMQEGT